MEKIRAAITGVQGYLPDYVLTNAELETMVDTNDEWITTRTGVKERRVLKGEGLGSSYMAEKAINALLEKKSLDPKEIDLIIYCTVTPDYSFPASANLLADKVGAVNAWGYDLMAACSGFIYGLTVGSQFIETGKHKKVLVVGSDKMSSIVNYKDRTTCILFGDACGVVLLEPDTSGNGIIDTIMRSDGSGGNYLLQKLGGSAHPITAENVNSSERYIYQDGQTVFKHAVTKMADVAAEIMQVNNLQGDDVAWLVPHQANKRIIDATANRMGVGSDKVTMNIEKYGNTTSATIPLCLWEWESKFKKGDNIIMAAFGGGFTWGAVYLKWAY